MLLIFWLIEICNTSYVFLYMKSYIVENLHIGTQCTPRLHISVYWSEHLLGIIISDGVDKIFKDDINKLAFVVFFYNELSVVPQLGLVLTSTYTKYDDVSLSLQLLTQVKPVYLTLSRNVQMMLDEQNYLDLRKK